MMPKTLSIIFSMVALFIACRLSFAQARPARLLATMQRIDSLSPFQSARH
jgi:hypothetical protein